MWVDNIKIGDRKLRWRVRDLIDLAQVRDQWRTPVNTVMNLKGP
jgi:hypothetical protein